MSEMNDRLSRLPPTGGGATCAGDKLRNVDAVKDSYVLVGLQRPGKLPTVTDIDRDNVRGAACAGAR